MRHMNFTEMHMTRMNPWQGSSLAWYLPWWLLLHALAIKRPA